jgi:hypothetical protein
MTFTIIPPKPAVATTFQKPVSHTKNDSDSDSDSDMPDVEDLRLAKDRHLVTPGELVTDDAQWMR